MNTFMCDLCDKGLGLTGNCDGCREEEYEPILCFLTGDECDNCNYCIGEEAE